MTRLAQRAAARSPVGLLPGHASVPWWHDFGTARSVTKYQLIRLMVKWPDYNVVSRGPAGDYGTKLRMYDVRRYSSGKSKLANTSGTGF